MTSKSLKEKSTDAKQLLTLANGCPERDGLVVYQARVLHNSINNVFTVFNGNCALATNSGDDDDNDDDNHNHRLAKPTVNNPIEAVNTIEVYPNPSSSNFYINLEEAGIAQATLKVYDVNGRLVLDKEVNTSEKNSVDIDLNAKSGIYFLVVTDTINDVVYKQKLVLQK